MKCQQSEHERQINRLHQDTVETVLWKFFKQADGTSNMNVDGSSASVDFTLTPPAGEIYVISRLNIFAKTTSPGTMHADGFFLSNTPLTNGIQLIYKIDGIEYDSTQGGIDPTDEIIRIKSNMDYNRYDRCALITSTGNADADFLNACIDFRDISANARINGDNNDAIIIRINDNLTNIGVAEFRIIGQGKFDPIGGIS